MEPAVLGKQENTKPWTARTVVSLLEQFSIGSGVAAIFHLVFVGRAPLSFPQPSWELLPGVGAKPKESDDVGHGLSQVLPEAMRILSFENKQTKYTT